MSDHDNSVFKTGIIVIGFLEGLALLSGIDGIALSAAIGAIFGISGYAAGRGRVKLRKRRETALESISRIMPGQLPP